MSSRYHFNLANGEDVIRDEDGIALSDIHAALLYAMKAIKELRAEVPSSETEWGVGGWRSPTLQERWCKPFPWTARFGNCRLSIRDEPRRQ
jgi:hypothetical protein